jgi:hypothetical protein
MAQSYLLKFYFHKNGLPISPDRSDTMYSVEQEMRLQI